MDGKTIGFLGSNHPLKLSHLHMSEPTLSTLADLDRVLAAAWSDLASLLAGLSETDLLAEDAAGWTIRDHLTHLVAWEDSVAALFQGRQRHEGLGVDATFYAEASFDEINDVIMRGQRHLTRHEALASLRRSHDALLAGIRLLSDADLNRTVADFFPQAARDDDRRMIDFIYENSAGHFAEHLEWMQAIRA